MPIPVNHIAETYKPAVICDRSEISGEIRKNEKRRDAGYEHKTDKIFFCESCRCAWEVTKRNGRKLHKYDSFPSYGLQRNDCPECSNES